MGFLRRRSGIEAELAALATRKDLLTRQLATAEQRLDEAVAARKVHLLEGDPDVPIGETPIIERLRDERSATFDALNTIGQRIAEAESKLAAERDLALRSAAGKELTAAADQLDSVAVDLAAVTSRLPEAMRQVLTRLPTKPVSKERVELFAAEVVAALQLITREGRSHAARITAGNGTICESIQQPATPLPPKVERLQIFPLQPSRWVETDGSIVTVGAHVGCSPPIEVARAALANGTALDVLSDLAITLRQRVPPNYGPYAAEDCIDLAEPRPTKQVGAPTAALPPIHSEFVGRPRVGTARVVGRI
jgi:hypothetical protein